MYLIKSGLSLIVLFVELSLAAPKSGPAVSIDYSQPGKVQDNKHDYGVDEAGKKKLTTEVFFPISVLEDRLQFLPVLYHYRELRNDRRNMRSTPMMLPADLSVTGVGGALIYSRYDLDLVAASVRYSSFRRSEPQSHMGEYFLGVTDNRFKSIFSASDTSASIIIRYRRFPHGDRWLPLIYYQIYSQRGFYLDLRTPARFVVGWDANDHSYAFFTGIRWDSENYPVFIDRKEAWTEGFVTTMFFGARTKVSDPLFIQCKFGGASETTTVYTREKKIVDYKTVFSPWVKFELLTLVHD